MSEYACVERKYQNPSDRLDRFWISEEGCWNDDGQGVDIRFKDGKIVIQDGDMMRFRTVVMEPGEFIRKFGLFLDLVSN